MFTNNLAPKFLLPVSLLIMLMSFSLSFFFIRHETATIESERINYSDSLARNLAYNAEYGALTRNTDILNNLVKGLLKEKDVIAIKIFDNKGNILIKAGEKAEPYNESLSPIFTKRIETNKKYGASDMGDALFFQGKNKDEGKQETIGQVLVYTSLIDMQNKLNDVKRRAIDITLIMIVITIAITFLLVRKITSPLKELVLATRIISDGDLNHKVKVMTNDEIGKLSISFNKMTEELSRTVVSKDYVDNIIKSMIDTLIVTNPDGTIRDVNQATINLLGYAANELMGKPVGMLFAENPESRMAGQPWIENLIEKDVILNTEATYIAKNAARIPVLLSGSVMKDDNDNIQGFVYIALDITERKRAEEMMRQSEERYRNLVETAPDIIYSKSISDGSVISLNPAFEAVMGWKRSDWIGRNFDKLTHPDDLALSVETTNLIAHGKTPPSYALRLLTKSGEYVVGEFTSAPQFDKGAVVAEFGIVRDITERKKAEIEKESLTRQLLQSEKMAAVGQLAGGVAHEINNPLGVILGFAQSLLHRLKEDDPILMPLQSIEREAKRCKYLVQDLLTFSRVGKPDKEKCDINDVVKSSLTIVEAQTKVRSVELIKEFGANISETLLSRNQIQQVIVNLCNNAIDAIPEQGKLTVRTLASKLGGKDYVELQVQDTGTGIPKDIQAKIFEPFFTTKEVGKGTGLGLSLVYEIIQKHQGKIELESEIGKGSVFKVLLPVT